MTKNQILEFLFNSLNAGRITEAGYDSVVSHIEDYVDEEDEEGEEEVNQ